jgi:hypothetical protein
MNAAVATSQSIGRNDGLVGVITLKDLLQFMSLKTELEKR